MGLSLVIAYIYNYTTASFPRRRESIIKLARTNNRKSIHLPWLEAMDSRLRGNDGGVIVFLGSR